eukprot:jgi/Tetstr1/460755/TSEL_005940.t1
MLLPWPPADPGATVRLPRSKPGPALSSRHAGVAKHVLSAAVKPDETDSELVFPAAVRPVAEQRYYEWGAGKRVAYRVLNQGGLEVAPLVLLTGFGVGSFHYDRLLKEMKGDRRDIYLMDFFGQGSSWPSIDPCPSTDSMDAEAGFEHGFGTGPVASEFDGFRFSADMWTEQVEHFVREIVGRKAVLCGNSLGGFIAVNLASTRPELVEGLVLLNATPFWGTTAVSFWNGLYPVPPLLKIIGTQWWNSIRSPTTIRSLLDFVYAKPYASGGYTAELVEQIIEPTRQKAAASAFCSILFSPPPERSFEHMLHDVKQSGIPCLLAYGREDPWVVPLWAMRLQRQLDTQSHYYELTPAGHCPQDEAPEAVAFLIDTFCEYVAGTREAMPQSPQLELGETKVIFHAKPLPRNIFEMMDYGIHVLKTSVMKQPF